VAATGVALWFEDEDLKAWTPNITVAALASALTITVVDRAVRREELARRRPRLSAVYERIGEGLDDFMYSIASDYAFTHLDDFQPIPSAVAEFMDFWILHADTRAELEGLSAQLFDSARKFAKVLDHVRLRDSDVIEPELISAIDTFSTAVDSAEAFMDPVAVMFVYGAPPPRVGLARVIEATKAFAEVLARYASDWLEVSLDTRERAEALRAIRAPLPRDS
jgi:hypothetical protein